jgi:hypothetical protein
MVFERNGNGYIVMIMLLQSDGYVVTEEGLWCYRVTVMVLQSNGHGVGE